MEAAKKSSSLVYIFISSKHTKKIFECYCSTNPPLHIAFVCIAHEWWQNVFAVVVYPVKSNPQKS